MKGEMRYAAALPIAGACGDARALGEFAHVAEEAGWDAVLLEDYIVYWMTPGQLPVCDPWIALAAMAMRTKRVQVGTSVTPLARRRPWKLARETVTLDHLSGGRVLFGVGVGDPNDWGFARVNEPRKLGERVQRFDEALDVLLGLWSGEPFSYAGRHFQVDNVTFLPRPLQRPRIPIWLGCAWPHRTSVRRAARFDGIMPYRVNSDGSSSALETGDLRTLIEEIRELRDTRSPPPQVMIGGHSSFDDLGRERARRAEAAGAGATWWSEWIVGPHKDVLAKLARGPARIE